MNTIQRFLFKDLNIRGQHLKINQAWQELIKDRGYPCVLKKLLGELTILSIMLANGMKHTGKITLQVQGQGPVNLLVVEVTHELKLRGVAKTNQKITQQITADQLLGNGKILVTLENTQTDTLFQSYVERTESSLIESFENFFSQSEQLPTKLWIASDELSLSGVMIQKLPDSNSIDPDGWNRITSLTTTITNEELCNLEPKELLHRLFHEEVLEIFESLKIEYHCPQDKKKIENMILALGEEEAKKILEEQGEIVIHNDICNFHLRFTKEDITRIFKKINIANICTCPKSL